MNALPTLISAIIVLNWLTLTAAETEEAHVKPPPAEEPRWSFQIVSSILPAAGKKPFLSLEDFQMYAEMPSNAPAARLELNREGSWELVIRNAHNYHTKRDQGMKLWEKMPAGEAAQPAGLAGLSFEREGYYVLRKEDMPITILIPQWGLLQVSRFNERAASAVLHFKRVVENRRRLGRKSPPRQDSSPPEAKPSGSAL